MAQSLTLRMGMAISLVVVVTRCADLMALSTRSAHGRSGVAINSPLHAVEAQLRRNDVANRRSRQGTGGFVNGDTPGQC